MPTTTLLKGDCLELLPTLPAGSVSLVCADLPYGVTRSRRWDTVIPLAPLWEQLLRLGTYKCTYVFTATQPFATALINSRPELFRYELIWDKRAAANFAQATYRVMRFHENVLIFSRGCASYGARNLMTYNPQMQARETIRRPTPKTKRFESAPLQTQHATYVANTIWAQRHPRSILAINLSSDGSRGLHPTQKPVSLLEWLVRTYSNPGDLVLDPTMGSATTGVACINTGRRFIGIEKDPAYFATCQKRVAEAGRQTCLPCV